MRKTQRPAKRRTYCYAFGDAARDHVVRTRDQLLLHARLAPACVQHDIDELGLSPGELVFVFQRLCDDLELALRDMKYRAIPTHLLA